MSSSFFFLMGGSCPPPGLRLYDADSGWLLDTRPLPAGDGSFSFNLTAVGLTEGTHQIGLTAVNDYGCESDQEMIEVIIAGGEAVPDFIAPQNISATPESNGDVLLEWSAYEIGNTNIQTPPAEFEVALPSSPTTPHESIGWNASRRFGLLISPGETGVYYIRSSDGEIGGWRGEWVPSPEVETDAVGPAAPTVDTALLPGGCGC